MGLTKTEQRALTLLTDNGVASKRIMMLTEVGSSAHGIISASEDTDYTAVFMQTFHELVNDCKESRMIRTAKEGERSGPDDIDINVYSLRRFARLAQNGNPSILTAIFSEKKIMGNLPIWEELAERVISKRVGYAFLGYMTEQLNRWEGKASKRVSRPELVDAFGYDTKYASHVLRLGNQGIEYMLTGRFSVPMGDDIAQFLTSVRAGQVSETDARWQAQRQMDHLVDLIDSSTFPESSAPIDEWLTETYDSMLRKV